MSKKFAYFIICGLIYLFVPFSPQVKAEVLKLEPPANQEKVYTPSAEGFKELLYDLYQFGKEAHYTIQFSGTLDLSQTTIGADCQQVSDLTLETINLSCISAKLTFKGIGAAAGLSLPDGCFFGQAAQFETLNLSVPKLYGNGHPIFFKDIQHNGNTQLFGGSNRDLVADPKLVFQQVSGGTWEIVGGNEAGVLTGNPVTQILDMTGNITQLCGGSLRGKLIGRTKTEVKNLHGELINYYGGGVGTAANHVEITGEIENRVQAETADFTLGNFVGGVAFGNSGAINTVINGKGCFSLGGIFIGGSQAGDITGNGEAVTTKIDTRSFQNGERNFVGGNQYSGRINGDIENEIYAGTVNKGAFNRIDGAGGMDIEKRSLSNSASLTPAIHPLDPQTRTPEELAYDQLNSAERFSLAKANTAFLVEGNVTTRILGGCVSGGLGADRSIRGAGFAGVVAGKVTLSLGEKSLAYSKTWGIHVQTIGGDPNVLPDNEQLGYKYGFSVAAGGGDSRRNWENTLYIRGTTELLVQQALLGLSYGGSFNGTIEGACLARMYGGQVSRINGAGNSCYRIYGNCQLEVTGGRIEDFAVAGGDQDRRIIGDLQTDIYGGEFLGGVAASIGLQQNHMVDGNVETVISGGRFKKKSADTQIMGGLAKEGMISGNVTLKLTDGVELLSGLNISAARPENASNKNILGSPDTCVDFEWATEKNFSDVTLLGDGGTDAKSLASPTIRLSLDAPNSDFSLIQGMNKNSFAGKLTHEIVIDVQAARAIKKVIGSDRSSFTNRMMAASDKKITLKFGAKQEQILVETIENYTHLTIDNQLSAQSILNGSGATNTNFVQNYHQFGEVRLNEQAELAVKELKTGELIVAEKAELHSPAGAETIFLRKLTTKDKLIWRLLEPENQQSMVGDYFAQQAGYPVMTFSDGESTLSPENFIGFDEQGRSYTGDTNDQIGLAVAATIIDYQVTSLIGKITHNLDLQENNYPLPLMYWGSGDDQQGQLIIPSKNHFIPRVIFNDTDQFSFQQAELKASNGEEKVMMAPFWEPSGNFYYQIQAIFQPSEGSLRLLAVPELFDFGIQPIGKKTIFYPKVFGELKIKDTRQNPEPWQLTLQTDSAELGEFFYQEAGNSASLNEAATIFSQIGSFETDFADWSDQKGVFLKVPNGRQKSGKQTITFHWRLTTKVE